MKEPETMSQPSTTRLSTSPASGGARYPSPARSLWSIALLAALVLALAGCGPTEADKEFRKSEPELVSPVDGHEFDKFPRTLVLEWRPMEGAVKYMVEVEMQNPNDGTWMPTPVALNKRILRDHKAFIEFPGAQPGRWRVVAYNAHNVESEVSDWWRFEFMR
jgi:hypothetical protein